MFSHEGSSRSDSQNRWLAGYLASVGGFSNSAGFVLIGTFTSHVTGNVGRLANDAARGQVGAAVAAASLVTAFFLGAFLVSVVLESGWFGHVSRAYAVALGIEAALLLAFTIIAGQTEVTHPRALDAEAALLCAAMGLQNGLVTRLSGAVVRTTHLTGVVTDLGIEAARWFRYSRKALGRVASFPLVLGPNEPERPAVRKIHLLTTIASSFVGGALVGAFATVHLGSRSMLLAVVAVTVASAYALRSGQAHDVEESVSSRR
jgi:uncharacterized membrane protein YoaK (UPF0700 family)